MTRIAVAGKRLVLRSRRLTFETLPDGLYESLRVAVSGLITLESTKFISVLLSQVHSVSYIRGWFKLR